MSKAKLIPVPRLDVEIVEAHIADIVRGLGLAVHHCHEADTMQSGNSVPENLFYEQLDAASDQAMNAQEALNELNDRLEKLVVQFEKRRRQLVQGGAK